MAIGDSGDQTDCSSSGIPQIYWTNGREPDLSGDNGEYVYHRVDPDIPLIKHNGKINHNIFIYLDNMSVIRDKECHNPKQAAVYDGLKFKHKINHNVVQIPIKKIEEFKEKLDQNNKTYIFKVKHDPLPCLYPHCEICCFRDLIPMRNPIPNSIKIMVSMHYAKISEVAINNQQNY